MAVQNLPRIGVWIYQWSERKRGIPAWERLKIKHLHAVEPRQW